MRITEKKASSTPLRGTKTDLALRRGRRARNQRERRRFQPEGKEKKVLFSMRVPGSWVAQFQRMALEAIAVGKYPWKTSQEVVRGLLGIGLAHVHDEEGGYQEFRGLMEFQLRLDDNERTEQTVRSIYLRTKERVTRLRALPDGEPQALQFFYSALSIAHDLPPTPWSTWLVRKLEEEFPDLAERVRIEDVPHVPLSKEGRKKPWEREDWLAAHDRTKEKRLGGGRLKTD